MISCVHLKCRKLTVMMCDTACSVPQQEHLECARLAEDRKLEKEEPGKDGGEGTAEDCGGPHPDGGGMHDGT